MFHNLYIKNCLTVIVHLLMTILILSSCENSSQDYESYDYKSIEEINSYLDSIASANPLIAATENVGTSEEGRTVKALVISNFSGGSTGPASLEMEPRIRLSGGIHGNEKITTEVLLRFIDYLVSEYNNGTSGIVDLVSSRYIVIIPVINPDGYARWSRYNTNGVDLNRNFGSTWAGTYPSYGTSAFSEKESQIIEAYSLEKRFTSSITMHSGSVIVNMPFDYGRESLGVAPAENYLVKYMGLIYSEAGTPPFYSNPDTMTSIHGYVYNGTINGGDWYVITGSMQDWSYLDAGCLDYTVEIADSYSPSTEYEVEQVYNYNRDSLTAFISESGIGVYGRVTSDGTTGLEGVKISVVYNMGSFTGDLVIYTDSEGYYHRLLEPGDYTLTFQLTGYTFTDKPVTVPDSISGIKVDVQAE